MSVIVLRSQLIRSVRRSFPASTQRLSSSSSSSSSSRLLFPAFISRSFSSSFSPMSTITVDPVPSAPHPSFHIPQPPPQSAGATNLGIFELVKEDHVYVEKLYTAYGNTNDLVQKRHIAGLIIRELSIHAVAEELSWYKLLKEKLKITGNKLRNHAMEEHAAMKSTLDKLDSMSVVDQDFDHQLCEVMKTMRHHVEEEEKNVIPPLEQHCSAEELKQMKLDWFEAKSKAPSRPHPWAPTSEVGAQVAAAVLRPFDAAKDTIRFGAIDKNEQLEQRQVHTGQPTKFQQ